MKIMYSQWKSYLINYIINIEQYLICNQIDNVTTDTTLCTSVLKLKY